MLSFAQSVTHCASMTQGSSLHHTANDCAQRATPATLQHSNSRPDTYYVQTLSSGFCVNAFSAERWDQVGQLNGVQALSCMGVNQRCRDYRTSPSGKRIESIIMQLATQAQISLKMFGFFHISGFLSNVQIAFFSSQYKSKENWNIAIYYTVVSYGSHT